MPVPSALLGWYRTAYPTLVFNPEWLEACVEYLQVSLPPGSSQPAPEHADHLYAQQNDPSATTTQGLIKAVEVQLLSSDLSTSVLPAPGRRGQLTTLHTATSPDKLLFPGGAKKAVLFQVQAVDDVAHSASSLLETLKEKREARKVAAKGGGGGGGRNMNLDDEESEDDDEAQKKVLTGEKVASYPRGSGKLVLSDGETEVKSFELQRINGFGLEEIKLGAKLLVHDVPFIDGVMLLTSKNVILKGYEVEELEQIAESALENSLRARLERPSQPSRSPPRSRPRYRHEAQSLSSPSSPRPPRSLLLFPRETSSRHRFLACQPRRCQPRSPSPSRANLHPRQSPLLGPLLRG
ncbi:SPOSA6832_03418 [Sporobolomyces salmonicolor]|uniref:RecQ-mediated genome instability protein 1 n=1 Tax=Sporidiobolus salmonicolor TaxID=5005 RepID=A0A0D6EP37_SPOSA|nr:SPOSA6832_03418 [Sporobolomyces salmonicolor]